MKLLAFSDLHRDLEQGARLVEMAAAADVVIGAGVRWGTMFKLIPERKEFTDYIARFADRPAAKRAQAKDEKLAKA